MHSMEQFRPSQFKSLEQIQQDAPEYFKPGAEAQGYVRATSIGNPDEAWELANREVPLRKLGLNLDEPLGSPGRNLEGLEIPVLLNGSAWEEPLREIPSGEPRVEVAEIGEFEGWKELIGKVRAECAVTVKREVAGKRLDYQVIDGNKVKERLPELWELSEILQPYAEKLWGDKLVPLTDQAAVNVNIVGASGEQGLHRDRNEVTLILYLTTPNRGGLQVVKGEEEPEVVKAQAGRLAALVGANQIPHAVQPVYGFQELRVRIDKKRLGSTKRN